MFGSSVAVSGSGDHALEMPPPRGGCSLPGCVRVAGAEWPGPGQAEGLQDRVGVGVRLCDLDIVTLPQPHLRPIRRNHNSHCRQQGLQGHLGKGRTHT